MPQLSLRFYTGKITPAWRQSASILGLLPRSADKAAELGTSFVLGLGFEWAAGGVVFWGWGAALLLGAVSADVSLPAPDW